MLLVAAPTRQELGDLKPGVAGDLAAAVTGLGRRSADALEAELERLRPSAVLSLGYAGALDPDLEPGDLVLCRKALAGVEEVQPAFAEVNAALLRRAGHALARLPCREGIVMTVAELMATRADKARAYHSTGALAVDMESYWMMVTCRAKEVPFLPVRAVFDTAHENLPPLISEAARAGQHPMRRTLWELVCRPWEVRSLPSLAKRAQIAGESLKRARAALVPSIALDLVSEGRG